MSRFWKSTDRKSIIGLEKIKMWYLSGQDVKCREVESDWIQWCQWFSKIDVKLTKQRVLDIIAEPLRIFERLSDQEERTSKSLLDIVGMQSAVVQYLMIFCDNANV